MANRLLFSFLGHVFWLWCGCHFIIAGQQLNQVNPPQVVPKHNIVLVHAPFATCFVKDTRPRRSVLIRGLPCKNLFTSVNQQEETLSIINIHKPSLNIIKHHWSSLVTIHHSGLATWTESLLVLARGRGSMTNVEQKKTVTIHHQLAIINPCWSIVPLYTCFWFRVGQASSALPFALLFWASFSEFPPAVKWRFLGNSCCCCYTDFLFMCCLVLLMATNKSPAAYN